MAASPETSLGYTSWGSKLAFKSLLEGLRLTYRNFVFIHLRLQFFQPQAETIQVKPFARQQTNIIFRPV